MTRRFRARTLVAAMAVAFLAAPTGAAPLRHEKPRRVTMGSPNRRGRPRKFLGPARAVTLTLPENVIAALRGIDEDLSRAVVRAAQPLLAASPSPRAELINYGSHAVIVVPQSRVLSERMGIELIPLSDGRALISFDYEQSATRLELQLLDALDDPALDDRDRVLFEELASILRTARQSDVRGVQHRQIIVLRHSNGHGNGNGLASPEADNTE